MSIDIGMEVNSVTEEQLENRAVGILKPLGDTGLLVCDWVGVENLSNEEKNEWEEKNSLSVADEKERLMKGVYEGMVRLTNGDTKEAAKILDGAMRSLGPLSRSSLDKVKNTLLVKEEKSIG